MSLWRVAINFVFAFQLAFFLLFFFSPSYSSSIASNLPLWQCVLRGPVDGRTRCEHSRELGFVGTHRAGDWTRPNACLCLSTADCTSNRTNLILAMAIAACRLSCHCCSCSPSSAVPQCESACKSKFFCKQKECCARVKVFVFFLIMDGIHASFSALQFKASKFTGHW